MSDCISTYPITVDAVCEPITIEVITTVLSVEVLRDANITIESGLSGVLPVFSNNQQAIAGGLLVNEFYRDPSGFVRVVLIEIINLKVNLSSRYSYFARAF